MSTLASVWPSIFTQVVDIVVDIEKNRLFNVVIVSFHVNISSQLSFYDFVYIM